MCSIAGFFDICMIESFSGTMLLEFLDIKSWTVKQELANAIFNDVGAFYIPHRQHPKIGMRTCARLSELRISPRCLSAIPRSRGDRGRRLSQGLDTALDRGLFAVGHGRSVGVQHSSRAERRQ